MSTLYPTREGHRARDNEEKKTTRKKDKRDVEETDKRQGGKGRGTPAQRPRKGSSSTDDYCDGSERGIVLTQAIIATVREKECSETGNSEVHHNGKRKMQRERKPKTMFGENVSACSGTVTSG